MSVIRSFIFFNIKYEYNITLKQQTILFFIKPVECNLFTMNDCMDINVD